MTGPLTAVDARVAAAILANWHNHPRGVPTWAGIAQRLSTWADQHPAAATEEGEMPSQSGNPGQMESTMEASNRTTPGERVNAQTEGLTTMTYVGDLDG